MLLPTSSEVTGFAPDPNGKAAVLTLAGEGIPARVLECRAGDGIVDLGERGTWLITRALTSSASAHLELALDPRSSTPKVGPTVDITAEVAVAASTEVAGVSAAVVGEHADFDPTPSKKRR